MLAGSHPPNRSIGSHLVNSPPVASPGALRIPKGRTLPNFPHAECTRHASAKQSTPILRGVLARVLGQQTDLDRKLEWAKVIERYTRPEMGAIWSERERIDAWLAVEKAVCEAWNRRGRIPDSAMPAIRAATCNIERMRQIEREVDHDVIAFLRATGESIGGGRGRPHWTHELDVVDTALALQATAATDLVLADLDNLIAVVGHQADHSPPYVDDRPYTRDACRTDDVRLETGRLV